jgi:hypothetical protein
MHNVDIDGYGDTFKGNDGLVIDATQTSSVLVAVAFSDFSDLPGNSIDATASDSAKLYVNVYGNSAISNAGLLGAEPVVARVAGEPATRFTARNNAQLSVGMIDNIFTSINATAIQVQALNTSLVNVSIHDNLMTGIGDSVGHEVIWIGGNRTASAATNQTFSATVNARITDNVIFDAYTAGIRVNADGGSTYNTAIHRNSLSYGEFYLASAFGIDVFATTFHTAKVNLAMTGNDVQILPGAAIGTMRVRVDSGTPVLKVEMTGSNIASFLTANNTLSAAAQVTVPQPTQQQVYVAPIGSFVSRIPLRLGDQLWLDVNKNGVLDPGALEKGVSGGIMTLTGTETEGGAAVSMRMITEEYLGYQFGALLPGTYTLKLLAPDGLDVTVADAESASTVDVDEDVDSDFSTDTRSVKVTLLAGVDKTNIDAGLVPASPWKNPDIGTDVNRDGFVAPLDALIVIIDLNAFGSRQLPAPTTTPTSFVDVNGDGFVTPLDALVVIIRLNSPQSEAGPQSEPIESVAALSQPIYTLPIVSPDFFYTALPAAQPDADGEEEASSLDAFFADLGA